MSASTTMNLLDAIVSFSGKDYFALCDLVNHSMMMKISCKTPQLRQFIMFNWRLDPSVFLG